MIRFAAATLTPFLLVACAASFGGLWVWMALIYLTGFIFLLDMLGANAAPDAPEDQEFPASTWLLITLGLLHFILIGLLIWTSLPTAGLETGARIGIAVATGLIWGQISHPVAHELIHARQPFQHCLGRWIYTSLLAGHHASAHLRLHHVHVGTARDPNTPRRGEGFYRYICRASRAAWLGGWREETRLHRGAWTRHPYTLYVFGGAGLFAAALAMAGPTGAAILLAVAFHAQIQMLMSDYVQHYGLTRRMRSDGTPEPLGPHHAWNAPHLGSSALMLNATRHSHHHMAARLPFPALALDPQTMPMLPHPLPVMAAIALVPPLWRRIMDPLAARWRQAADAQHSAAQIAAQAPDRAGHDRRALSHSRHAQTISGLSFAYDPGLSSARGDERGRI